MMNETFCQRLIRLRESKGMSQKELAKKCDFKTEHVEYLEAAEKHIPSWFEIKKLAKAFDADPLSLATGDEYHVPNRRQRFAPEQNQLSA